RELEPVSLQPAPPPPPRPHQRADPALLGCPRQARAAGAVRRDVGARDRGRAPARVRRVRSRAAPGGAGRGRGGHRGRLAARGGGRVTSVSCRRPPDEAHPPALWQWGPPTRRHYDPALGHTLYNQYLDQLEYAERLGWDGLCVNEHHQNCYGTMPSPNVMA